MRKLLIALPLLLLGCGQRVSDQEQARINDRNKHDEIAGIMAASVIICADGNQVRASLYNEWGNATIFSGWTILDENGKPKRCVKRIKPTPPSQPEYEEVPQ